MGCDIHAVFQAKTADGWRDVKSAYEADRHYFLFAWLADVRNGHGFAGIVTGTQVKPIAKPRGYPEDFAVSDDRHEISSEVANKYELKYPSDNGHLMRFMGDHSHSWLTADEILSASRPEQTAWHTGYVDLKTFNEWSGVGAPKEYCGDISGKNIDKAESPLKVHSQTTHVRVFWKSAGELDYFVDEVRRLKEQHGDVRMVFGFDS